MSRETLPEPSPIHCFAVWSTGASEIGRNEIQRVPLLLHIIGPTFVKWPVFNAEQWAVSHIAWVCNPLKFYLPQNLPGPINGALMLRYFPGIQHGFLCTTYLQKTLCDADLARSHAILCDRVCMFSITSRFLFLPYISIFVIFPSFSFDIKR